MEFSAVLSCWCSCGPSRWLPEAPGAEIPGIEILKRQVGDTTYFSLRNSQLAELTVGFDSMLRNLASNVQLPLELVIPPQTTTAPLNFTFCSASALNFPGMFGVSLVPSQTPRFHRGKWCTG